MKRHLFPRSSNILIRLEAPSILPVQYKGRVLRKYGLVISPGNFHEENTDGIGWPYEVNANPASPTSALVATDSIQEVLSSQASIRDRSSTCVFIGSNKVSPNSENNYQIRRDFVSSVNSNHVEIFGSLWNVTFKVKIDHRLRVLLNSLRNGYFPDLGQIHGNLFRSYQHVFLNTPNKHEILKRAKFNVIIENSNFVVTEKIFDALLNGCIPLYFGPRILPKIIERCIIRLEQEQLLDISAVIHELDDNNLELKQRNGREFMASDEFRDCWSVGNVWYKIAQRIHEHLSRA